MKLLLALLIATGAAAPAPAAAPSPNGTWRNAANSVHVRVAPCPRARATLCGTVIWANAKAKADVAARGGALVGEQLFRDFVREDDGLWYGQVYVPDLARTFSGTLDLDGPDRLVGEGCLLGSFGCRQQVWTRLKK
ncbi:Uncharacterized conserved protein, DUF2147 family [Sphingomonas guangdongensis]|uniref:Uncharacterized conserved protein, DUF2147 family n=1 Tax=Sphingomonas guangdongensis TaxID=1141890 RepID=A0A285R302_9SPHN|nr:DUF2147 domain-containing protein [Sphingomonas guangdongensis]SOB86722.1 Uncharacterized conserved protein, DUF2147 family [Sphingomonas guangdongensis]